MPVIATIGAGPGLGTAVARRFGRKGFSIALISKNQSKLDAMAAEIKSAGFPASGYAADVLTPASLEGDLACAAAKLGFITALQYSPLPSRGYLTPVLEMTPRTGVGGTSVFRPRAHSRDACGAPCDAAVR